MPRALIVVPAAARLAVARTVTVTEPPEGMLPTAQLSVPAATEQPPCVALALTNVVFRRSSCVKVLPVAVDGPALLTTNV